MNERMINFYMTLTQTCADMSRAIKLKVGCVIVKNDNIISFSWNGTPHGWDNDCEYKEYPDKWVKNDYVDFDYPLKDKDGAYYRLATKPEVIHAEMNCLMKVTKSNNSSKDATMFVTHAPCVNCAKHIFTAGINKLYYREQYRSTDGIDFLKKCNVEVIQTE